MSEPKKHRAPVWREKANYRLAMKIDNSEHEEELWSRQLSDELFEVCCIPFFVYDIHLGDIIKIVPHESKNLVLGVQTPSGHHTFRVWFKTQSPTSREQVFAEIEKRDLLHERFDNNFLSVDAPDDATANSVARWLGENGARLGFDYETGRTED